MRSDNNLLVFDATPYIIIYRSV